MHVFFEVIKDTLTITCLVMIMMLLIEFVNVSSAGKWMSQLQHRPFLQILLATVLGMIPGCIGGFAIVSLFTHNMVSFGALVAGMIATFGDESFVMLAYSPKWTFVLTVILAAVAVVVGVITHLTFRKKRFVLEPHGFEVHDGHEHNHGQARLSWKNLRNVSFPRALLIFGLLLYILAIVTGVFSHEHGAMPGVDYARHTEASCREKHVCGSGAEEPSTACHGEHHGHRGGEMSEEVEAAHHHHHEHGVLSGENVIFLLLAAFTLAVVALSSEHFLQSHLWEHVIRHHFLSVFLWSFGVLSFLKLLYLFADVNALFASSQWAVWVLLLIAVGIGFIPESGPHLIFVIMFFSGAVPFSVLLANSIVQDGHGALPLLAQSRRNFFLMKGISMLAGLIVGAAGLLLGF